MQLPEQLTSSQLVEKLLAVQSAFQGQKLNREQAELLGESQAQALKAVLNEGFQEMQAEVPNILIEDITYLFTELRGPLESVSDISERVSAITNALPEFYTAIHDPEAALTISQKVFAEFLLGLLCFECNILTTTAIASELLGENHEAVTAITEKLKQKREGSAKQILSELDELSKLNIALVNNLVKTYLHDTAARSEEFWFKVQEAFNKYPELKTANQEIVSMRHIPDDEEGRQIVSLMQTLHWAGFGGQGQVFAELPQLLSLPDNALAWFKDSGRAQSAESAGLSHFTSRLGHFGKAIVPMKDRAASTTAALLETRFSTEKELRIFGLGAGNGAYETQIANSLSSGRAAQTVLTDVGSSNLAAGAESVAEVRYLDLLGQLTVSPSDKHSYHLVSAGVALHQIVDSKRGKENLIKVFKFATELLQKEGIFSVADVNRGGDVQSVLIQANLVDREGHLPANIYETISFTDLAVEQSANTAEFGETSDANKIYSVLVPLNDLYYTTPERQAALNEHGEGIYGFTPYIKVEVSGRQLQQMEAARTQSNWNEVYRVVDEARGVEQTLNQLQQEVLDGVNESVH